MTSRLPNICRRIFTILTILCLVAAIAVVAVIIVDPKLPQKATITFDVRSAVQPSVLRLQAEHGVLNLSVADMHGSGFIRGDAGVLVLSKRFGLPIVLAYTLFGAILFDLFRRLFRNVGRGDSFTSGTIGLVRITGLLLIGFSLLSVCAESLFSMAILDYLRAKLTGPETSWIAPEATHFVHFEFPLATSFLLSGLLVLALSEVFRQGLALKSDNELTI